MLLNDKVSGLKVLSTIDSELNKCDEFWFSVAFLTTSGVATLINTLVELQNKNVTKTSSNLQFSDLEPMPEIDIRDPAYVLRQRVWDRLRNGYVMI